MKIIKVGELPKDTKRITCEKCKTIFEFHKRECRVTNIESIVNIELYNISCPVCKYRTYLSWE